MSRMNVLYGVLILALGVLYALLARPHVAGFEYDDGAYLLAAQALARGQGYVLPYTEPLQALVKYPPLTSLVMSPLWWLPVDFPNNVMFFKGLNVLLSLVFLGMLGFYSEHIACLPRWQSLCILLLTGLHPQFVHVATEILSEPLYLVLSMGLFLTAGFLQSAATVRYSHIGIWLLLAVLAYYTRTVGILLVIALPIWLFLTKKKKEGVLTLLIGTLFCSGWLLWTNMQPDFTQTFQMGERAWVLRTLNESYFTSIKTDLLYHYTWFDLYTTGLAALFGQWAVTFFPFLSLLPLWVSLIAGFVLLALFLLLALQNMKEKNFSLPGLYIALYLAILPFWAYHEQYPRFLIVILPFLWLYLFQLTNQSHEKLLPAKTPHVVIPLLVAAITLYNLLPVCFRLLADRGNAITIQNNPPVWDDFIATTTMIKKNTSHEDTLWVSHLIMPYALYTNRKYFDAFLQLPPKYLDTLDNHDIEVIQREQAALWRYQFIKMKVRYVVANPVLLDGKIIKPVDETTRTLLNLYPGEFQIAYISPNRLITVFEFTGNKKNP